MSLQPEQILNLCPDAGNALQPKFAHVLAVSFDRSWSMGRNDGGGMIGNLKGCSSYNERREVGTTGLAASCLTVASRIINKCKQPRRTKRDSRGVRSLYISSLPNTCEIRSACESTGANLGLRSPSEYEKDDLTDQRSGPPPRVFNPRMSES